MQPDSNGFHTILQSFQDGLKQEELEAFGGTTLKDVHTTIVSIQARQETERTMMDMTRLRDFLDRMKDLTTVVRSFDEATDYMAFIWGPLNTMLQSTSQDQKALDILLDAYDKIGNSIPVLQDFQAIIALHPDLCKILELIYQDVLEFQESALRLSTHPHMRTLFRSMWNDYIPRFEAKLKTLEKLQALTKQITNLDGINTSATSQNTMNFYFTAGNHYDGANLYGNSRAHFGDVIRVDSQQDDARLSEILTQVRNIHHSLEGTKLRLETEEKQSHDERCVKIREWIAGSLPYRHQELKYETHCAYPQTGLWILKNHLVAAWMKDDPPRNPLLWIHGIPGAGKTVLASVLINACEKIENSHTAYFYCQYNDQETNTTIAILRGLLMQAITWRPELLSYFDEQRRQGGEPTICKEQTAKKLTNLILHDGGQIYLVIDGIDECSPDDRKSTLLFLNGLVQEIDQKSPGKLRLMVISQNEPGIRRALINAAELPIDKNLNGNDIGLYVKNYAERIRAKFDLNQQEAWALQRMTCWHAAGQFLYAELVMKNLLALSKSSELREHMQDSRFPESLTEAYEKIVERIKKYLSVSEWKAAQQLLGWMTCAARSLKWHEMQGAMSINFEGFTVDFEEHSLRIHVEELCGALVSVHDDRISLVHMTAREFITRSKHIDHPAVECQLANLCIRYLGLPCFDMESTSEELRDYLFEGHFAFADYAAAKWMYHLYRVAEQAETLVDGERWNARVDEVNGLLDTMAEFGRKFDDDLQENQNDARLRQVDTRLNPAIVKLLDSCDIEHARASFQKLWAHAEASRTGAVEARHTITLQSLRKAIEQMRKLLEEEFSNKELEIFEQRQLKRFYGDKIYRCSKTTCFFFHQGFGDRISRNRHVARHDRLYQCTESDCPAAEIGFADKKALRAHLLEAHPDSELKALLFEKPEVKQSKTKFRCEPCDKNFTRNAALQAHQRVHAGQKPFPCSKCGKPFARKSDCIRHEKTHENRIS